MLLVFDGITGSHGAGDPSETLTPLLAWGAGIRTAQYTDESATQQSPQGTLWVLLKQQQQ